MEGHWRALDESLFSSLYVVDHPSFDAPDPWPYLAYVAGKTARIRLGTHVTGAPFHHPTALARAVTTVDRLSRGRATLGIGSGWATVDFQPYGFPYQPLGKRLSGLEETIRILKGYWSDEAETSDTPSGHLMSGTLNPKPVQRPHPPIIVGLNTTGRAARIAVRHAQGINTWQLGPEQVLPIREHVRELCEATGRNPEDLLITADVLNARGLGAAAAAAMAGRIADYARTGGRGGPATDWNASGVLRGDADEICGQVARFAEVGVSELTVALGSMDDMEWFNERVVARFKQ
jgi:alkanesulfonate monooxygenase SsuD/methylene tetrahydromethanopterin reductase-like flavin-dependent oxidoreductase (luciferase family)